MKYYVYIVECADKTLYTGIARDVKKRVAEHNSDGTVGAKYTRARQPVRLRYSERKISRSAALKREHAIKCLTRAEKMKLIRDT